MAGAPAARSRRGSSGIPADERLGRQRVHDHGMGVQVRADGGFAVDEEGVVEEGIEGDGAGFGHGKDAVSKVACEDGR